MVPEPKFNADFKNPFLDCRKWGYLGEKVVFRNLPLLFLAKIPRSHGKIQSPRVEKTRFFIVFTLMLNNITALTVAAPI